MNKFHTTVLLGLLLSPSALAQYFNLEYGTVPYQELNGATAVNLQGGWGQITALNGEAFSYFEEPFVFGGVWQIWVHQSGFLNIDHAPVSTIFVSGLFKNFSDLVPIDGTSTIKYQVQGASGARKLIVQWKNYRSASGPSGNYVNFQIILDQASGEIRIHYGPTSHPDHVYPSGTGPNAGYYYAEYNTSPIYERLWLLGDPTAPTVDTALQLLLPGLQRTPPEGMMYRFVPSIGSAIGEIAADNSMQLRYADDHLLIDIPDQKGELQVVDPSGRLVRSHNVNGDLVRIQFAELARGTYMLAFHPSDGPPSVARFIRY